MHLPARLPKLSGLWFGLITYVGVMNAFCIMLAGLSGDKAIIIYQSHSWFLGQTPYRDFAEVNMPMNMMVLQISHFIGHFWGLGLQQVANLHMYLMILLCVFITAFSYRLLRLNTETAALFSKTDIALAGLLLWGFSESSFAFADREFMILAFTFLYFLRFSPPLLTAALPLRHRLLIGLLAAIGFCIKPHTLVFWLASSIFLAVRHRSLKYIFYAENLVIYAFTAAYLAYVYFALPEYFHTILPLAREFYGNYSQVDKYSVLAIQIFFYSVLLIVIGFVDWRPSQKSPYLQVIPYYFSILLGCYAYMFINNGWIYTLLPASVFSLLIVCIMFKHHEYIKLHDTRFYKNGRQAMIGISAVLISYAINTFSTNLETGYQSITYGYPTSPEIVTAIKNISAELESKHARSFAAFSMDHSLWYPAAVVSGKEWGLSINHYWMISDNPDESLKVDADWRHRFIYDRTMSDLESRRPDIVFVPDFCDQQTTCLLQNKMSNNNTRVYSLLNEDPAFRQYWQDHYSYLKTVFVCDGVVYKASDKSCYLKVFGRR